MSEVSRAFLTGMASDVKEVDALFLDSKRSAARLMENKGKYLL